MLKVVLFLLHGTLMQSKADALYEQADAYYYKRDYSAAAERYLEAAQNYEQIGNAAKEATSFNDAGLCFYKMGEFRKAIEYYRKAVSIDMETGNEEKIYGRLRNLAIAYRSVGEFSSAISSLKEAYDISLRSNSFKNLASLNTSFGNLYLDQGRYSKALLHFKSALSYHENLGNQKGVAISYTNLGIGFYHLNMLDSSVYYYNGALAKNQTLGDTSSLAYSYNGLGKVYLKKSNYDSAEYYFQLSYKIRDRYNEASNRANTANELARLYITLGGFATAKPYLDQAYRYAESEKNRTILMENLKLMSDYHKGIGSFGKAYGFLERWAAMRDSVFNQEKLKTLELQSEYDLARSEGERQLAQKEADLAQAQSERISWVAVVLGVFLIASIVFTWVIFAQRKRLGHLNAELDAKNAQISAINKQNFHFTKNSLAEVVSMLNVQLKGIAEGSVKDVLMAEKLRMETINLLYRQLFASPEEGEVELASLIKSIVRNTVDAILGDRDDVSLDYVLESCHVLNAKALSIGMIANEISLNASKYAFEGGGHFKVVLEKKQNEIHLRFVDDGPGFSEEPDPNTFGTKLIDVLSRELKAEVSIDNSKAGVSYYFRIPFS